MLPISCTLQSYTDYLHPSQNFEVLRFLPSITCRRIMVGRHSRTARILQIYCGMCTPAQPPPSMQSLEVSQSIIDSFEKAIVETQVPTTSKTTFFLVVDIISGGQSREAINRESNDQTKRMNFNK